MYHKDFLFRNYKWVFMSVSEGLVGTLEAKSEILDVVHVVGTTQWDGR